jgi:phospho-N-acetylmuramoyl-pentapeptide-transferase
MFYQFLYPLAEQHIFFNVFRYITFRSSMAAITAFLICVVFGPWIIERLRRLKVVGSTERQHADKIHDLYKDKKEVPTMGGILIVLSVLVSNFLWMNFSNRFSILVLVVVVWYGILGFLDDYLKIRFNNTKGISSRTKLIGQLSLAIIFAFYLYWDPAFDTLVTVPFFKNVVWTLGILYIPFIICVMVGTSNAINLTDGLDGLAIGCLAVAAMTFGVIAYLVGNSVFAGYLQLTYIDGTGELAVVASSLVGASIGFLWWNAPPANVFMGDTGSLALGGALGAIAIFVKNELVLLIVGGVFAWEALSVIIQVISFKLTGKRVFLMAPFHHHLQLKGWPESKVTIRLWIIAFILALIGLSTLKLR